MRRLGWRERARGWRWSPTSEKKLISKSRKLSLSLFPGAIFCMKIISCRKFQLETSRKVPARGKAFASMKLAENDSRMVSITERGAYGMKGVVSKSFRMACQNLGSCLREESGRREGREG